MSTTTPVLQDENRFRALFLEDDDPDSFIHPDTGATKTCVTKDTKLINEIETPIGMKVGSCSNHIIESESKGQLPFKNFRRKQQQHISSTTYH